MGGKVALPRKEEDSAGQVVEELPVEADDEGEFGGVVALYWAERRVKSDEVMTLRRRTRASVPLSVAEARSDFGAGLQQTRLSPRHLSPGFGTLGMQGNKKYDLPRAIR